ncbi:TonB-dependent receptor [Nitrincola lacisaponensis]|uniref:TonB-dependent receptor n=1 Tax=Nitrincola lacisaponensis TaxID=267850 RepID=A0A063Y3B4_9GAMM|nr:TonB-dependent receptor [Nitrincola lacisaponensis]KDE39655.1 TonB-dependent receptor [Nitrincola lacisaponensis]
MLYSSFLKQNTSSCLKRATAVTVLPGMLTLSLSLSADTLFLKETDLLSDLPVVTSASRLKQNQHTSPASVTILDRETISASGAQTLPDLLALVPGFQLFQINSNRQGVNYHGVNDEFPNQLDIMVNGRSVYLPLLSTVLWHTLGIHPEDIERVEVVRGSNAATHGSNAFLGAVNFITRHSAADADWRVSGTFGSMNSQNGYASHSGQLDGLLYRVSVASESNDGSNRFHDATRRHYLNAEFNWSPSLHDNLTLQLGYDKGMSHIGYLFDYRGFPEGEHYISQQDYQAYHQQLTWTRWLNNDTQLHAHLYRNALRLDETPPSPSDIQRFYQLDDENLASLFLSMNPGFRGYREHGRTHVIDAEIALEHRRGSTRSYTGMGIRRDKASSPVLLQSSNIESERLRLFHSSMIEFNPKLRINLGLMHEHQSATLHGTSGRIALNHQITPQTSLRIGYSHSERLPSILEKNGNYSTLRPDNTINQVDLSNPALQAEHVQSWELGMHHQFTHLEGFIDIRAFHEEVSDAIVNVMVNIDDNDRAGQKQNAGYWRNQGIEAQLKLQPVNHFWMLFNYSYLDNQVGNWSQGLASFFDGGQLAPRHTLSALANWQLLPDLNLSTSYYAMDSVRWRRSYGTLAPQPRFQRIDLKLAKSWSGPGHQLELAAVVQNALHKSYQTFYQDHRFDRRTLVQLKLTMD